MTLPGSSTNPRIIGKKCPVLEQTQHPVYTLGHIHVQSLALIREQAVIQDGLGYLEWTHIGKEVSSSPSQEPRFCLGAAVLPERSQGNEVRKLVCKAELAVT